MNYPLSAAIGVFAALALSGCGGGGGGSGQPGPAFCEGFSGGTEAVSATNDCGGCTPATQTNAAADRDLFTAAVINTGVFATTTTSLRARSPSVFAAGGNAGAFVTYDGSDPQPSLTINTYLGPTLQESAPGARHTNLGTVGGTGAARYISFSTAQPFDSVEIVLTRNSTAGRRLNDLVYELCGHGAVQ